MSQKASRAPGLWRQVPAKTRRFARPKFGDLGIGANWRRSGPDGGGPPAHSRAPPGPPNCP